MTKKEETQVEETKTTETKPKTTTTRKTTTRKPTTRKTTTAKKEEKSVEELAQEMAKEMAEKMAKEIAEKQATSIAKELAKEMLATSQQQINSLQQELKEKTKVEDHELVTVRSLTEGDLVYKTRDGIAIVWEGAGSVQELPMKELRFMRNAHSSFLTRGYLIIEDKEAVKELHLETLYERVGKIESLENVLELKADELEKALENLPKGLLKSLGDLAAKKVKKKELMDLRKIEAIQKATNVDLKLFT